MKRKKIIYVAVAAVLAVAAVVMASAELRGHRQEPSATEVAVDTVHLNKVLTNAMSGGPEESAALRKMDARVERYMQYWHLRGAQLAVMRNDSLLWCKGYGIADLSPEGREDDSTAVEMTPGTVMRVASVSKLITAAGIMKLQEEGKLHLGDSVFGEHGILNDSLYLNTIRYPKDYGKITVEHLLRHQAGFRRDPVFSANSVREQMDLDHAPELDDYSSLVLSRQLRHEPGMSQRYSNYGYMLLSRIIEKVSGMDYESYMQSHVLQKAGCFDMHIAGNYYSDKLPNESRYFVHEGDGKMVEEYNGSGKMVERCYGGNDIRLLEGAGAWVCSAAELARLVASIDFCPEVAEILSKESIELMTEYTDSTKYSLGWNDTNPRKGWVRTGTLAGTNAVIKYFPDGECWIWLSNTSTWKGPGHAKYTTALFDELRQRFSNQLPSQNLFLK